MQMKEQNRIGKVTMAQARKRSCRLLDDEQVAKMPYPPYLGRTSFLSKYISAIMSEASRALQIDSELKLRLLG